MRPLLKFEITVSNPAGLHARPLSKIVAAVESYGAPVTLVYNGNRCNAASILDMLCLCIPCGAQIQFETNSSDEIFFKHIKELNKQGVL